MIEQDQDTVADLAILCATAIEAVLNGGGYGGPDFGFVLVVRDLRVPRSSDRQANCLMTNHDHAFVVDMFADYLASHPADAERVVN
jgi:hypothetical protein